MMALLLEPHQDDAALFASFLCLRHRPRVVTVLRSVNQEAIGITAGEREAENAAAMEILGCEWEQWPFPDDDPDWLEIGEHLEWRDQQLEPERVFAPWPQPDGHEQHNRVGDLARQIFGDRVVFYTTYVFAGGRTAGAPVDYEPAWIALKHRALACYRSQIERGPHRFFMMALDEYTAP